MQLFIGINKFNKILIKNPNDIFHRPKNSTIKFVWNQKKNPKLTMLF